MKKDEEVTRISGIRDNQSNVMIERFKELISEDRLDDAFSIADEWFEWLHPSMAEKDKHCIQMKKNSNEHTPDSQKVDESLRALIMDYIDAQNSGDEAKAEVLLHNINEMRRLCDGS